MSANRDSHSMLRKRRGTLLQDSWESNIIKRSNELDALYNDLGLYPHDLGVWNRKHTHRLDVSNFRSNNVYVWQTTNSYENQYLTSFLLAKLQDHTNSLGLIFEDGAYGAKTYEFLGEKVSRDRIDSSLEINFLIDCVSAEILHGSRVLDIGAGYGRLAKNLCKVFPSIEVGCVDSIPISTAISEFYLQPQVDTGQITIYDLLNYVDIPLNSIDLATNIHSFSEMSLESVKNWAFFLSKIRVPRLFIVPNSSELRLNTGEDFQQIFEEYGYFVKVKRAKYLEGIDANLLLYPSTYFYLELE